MSLGQKFMYMDFNSTSTTGRLGMHAEMSERKLLSL